jgi:hypothetical protein
LEGGAIEFDVAVTAGETQSQGGSGGITIVGLGLKGEGKAETANTTVSRVRFSVPIGYPTIGPDPFGTTIG